MSKKITLQKFIEDNKITIAAVRTQYNPCMDRDMDHYKATLYHSKRQMTIPFSKGYGNNGEFPTVDEVLECLASDSAGFDNSQSFEDWCDEYGFEHDAKAKKTYAAVERNRAKLQKFLGDNLYKILLWNIEEI